ncbi:GNAT family N-acetyltransferase [Octadecabacter sp. 1_MG-2023]|uniref:GNAT family N-acetyltransferase n=1 Tax=unclassified Octadecabacter TaxID=196158 RepID=UPI001C09F0BF|nr:MULTISPECIES: GNAT family N-acetyltransferase [unclassified Octadecabacter]MBU2992338.1 GNAT family N-acetyltransferase [Octadecabacter sp. B2R22]MDO6734905.1 GNAT family N-acetyltransferase [Octadecabacter sp. 1_MG-2023]
MTFETRTMTAGDVPACVAILNPIIAAGGTTAYEDPYTEQAFLDHYFSEPPVSNVVLHNGTIIGFQAAFEVEQGIYSIGTFTDRNNPVRGAGAALMAKTKSDCRTRGGTAILAKITEDNTGALAFYSKMGFEDFKVDKAAHTRKSGKVVDKVIKRLEL